MLHRFSFFHAHTKSQFSAMMKGVEIDFCKDPAKILAALLESKKHDTLIGIKSPSLGDGIFVTSVTDIVFHARETVIVLRNFDMTGEMLRTNILRLHHIEGIFPFMSKFENPVLKSFNKNLRED